MDSGKFSLRTRFGSFRYAFKGLISLLSDEHNARVHLLAAIIAVATGFILKINPFEWCLLALVIGLVFLTELINSALEDIADAVDHQINEKIRKAKDYSAAAVLVSAIVSVIVGALIFIPRLLKLI
jgi:diacylglycerol kinase